MSSPAITMRSPTRSRTRWLGIGLVASLALNAFFIGAAATDLFRLFGDEPRPVHFELRWLQDRLAQPDFDAVAAAVTNARPDAERHIATLKSLRQELGMLAADPNPDRAAIDAKLVEIRSELGRMLVEVQKTAIDAVLALPAQSRKSLASSGGDVRN